MKLAFFLLATLITNFSSLFYRGCWKNGVMSGYGIYIWEACYNNLMSLPSITAYRGNWERGQRNGYGVLNLGFGLGSYYKGEFKKDKKHGVGMVVTNSGLILQVQNLFIDDNFGSLNPNNDNTTAFDSRRNLIQEPYKFDICDQYIGLFYHIDQTLKRLDKEKQIRDNIICDYLENNKAIFGGQGCTPRNSTETANFNFEEFVTFEEIALRKSLQCYETQLKSIYYQYATICNTEEIYYTPVLIRLYFWQLFYDCNIHDKGLTLIDIDRIFHANPAWLSKSPHNPFEKIYFWQFLHCLIAIASKLYAKRQLPDKKPDTILSCAFRTFMDDDILPGVGRKYGRLTDGYGLFVPLTGAYDLYRSIGEPCTVRDFLCAIRHAPHSTELQPVIVEGDALLGQNAYVFGDEITFVAENIPFEETNEKFNLELFNISNLASKTVIYNFSCVFPQVMKNGKIMDLEVELVFFEFFEVLIACIEESIKLKDEEAKCQEKYSTIISPPYLTLNLPKTK